MRQNDKKPNGSKPCLGRVAIVLLIGALAASPALAETGATPRQARARKVGSESSASATQLPRQRLFDELERLEEPALAHHRAGHHIDEHFHDALSVGALVFAAVLLIVLIIAVA